MIELIIKKGGYYIELPGIAPFRTPVRVNISKLNIKEVKTMLRGQGVEEYEIIRGKDKSVKKATKKLSVSSDGVSETNIVDFKELHKRFDNLEKILQKFIDKKPEVHEVRTIIKEVIGEETKPSEDEIDDLGQFIPEVDTEGMKIRTSGFKIEKLGEGLEKSSRLLSKYTKGKNGRKSTS